MPSTAAAPLAGTKIVSVAVNLPGPLAAARLVELGAEVVKVEPPSGDPLASIARDWYDELITGQQVVVLDLKDSAGQAAFEQLLAGADLLITSSRPSANERLGLPTMVERYGLAHVEIVGSCDDPEQAGHDLTYQAAFGTVVPPAMPSLPIADLLGAERATSAALAMLRARDSGRPAACRVALADAARWASSAMRLTGPGALLSGRLPNYNLYPAAQGWIAVAALEPHFAARLEEHIGADEQLAAIFATRTAAEWESFGAEHDIPLVAVRDRSQS